MNVQATVVVVVYLAHLLWSNLHVQCSSERQTPPWSGGDPALHHSQPEPAGRGSKSISYIVTKQLR